MKLGVALCGEKVPKPLEATKELYNKGITTLELGYNRMFTPEEIKKLKEFDIDWSIHCPSHGLRFECFLPSLITGKVSFYFPKQQIREMEKGFSVAEQLEATHYVMHGGVFPKGYFRFKVLRQTDNLVQIFNKSLKNIFLKAKDTGVKIVLENLMRGNFFSDVYEIRKVLEEFPWIGFCLDFAHSELSHQTNVLRDLKIEHIHVSDNDRVIDNHLPLGKGKINLNILKGIIKEKGFKGKLLTECKNVNDSLESFAHLKKNFK